MCIFPISSTGLSSKTGRQAKILAGVAVKHNGLDPGFTTDQLYMTLGKLLNLFLSLLLCCCRGNNNIHFIIANIKQDDIGQVPSTVPGTYSTQETFGTIIIFIIVITTSIIR